jgi:hypothetical protein
VDSHDDVVLGGAGSRAIEPGPFSLARHVADLVATLDTLDALVLLVGHSKGHKWPSWRRSPPGQVAGLVLLAPVPLGGAGLSAEQLAPFIELGGQPQRQHALREQLSVALTPERLDRLVREGAQFTPAKAEASARARNAGDPQATSRPRSAVR